MSDRQIRAAQRTLVQDPDNPQLGANLLRALIQGGQVEPELIRQIASLGDPVGLILFPGEEQFAVKEFLIFLGDKRFCLEFAVYCARKVLPIWESKYPVDNMPRLAIESAEAWLSDPSEANKQNAFAAANLAYRSYGDASDSSISYVGYAASVAAFAVSDDCDLNEFFDTYPIYVTEAATSVLKDVTDKELLIEFLTKDLGIG